VPLFCGFVVRFVDIAFYCCQQIRSVYRQSVKKALDIENQSGKAEL